MKLVTWNKSDCNEKLTKILNIIVWYCLLENLKEEYRCNKNAEREEKKGRGNNCDRTAVLTNVKSLLKARKHLNKIFNLD